MTKEEAKKMGATHYKEYPYGYIEYYLLVEGKWCYMKNGWEIYSTNLSERDLKPL